ncbi:MAG: hypothetical protein NVSMB18_12050 [Acetobacteraceae bacterium]
MDGLTALRLQLEWGADEALGDRPLDRFAPAHPAVAVAAPRAQAARPAAALAALPPAATSLDALHDAMCAFDGCPLSATATHTVRADGNPAAGIVLIGDAPGSDDDRSGRAFSGPPGQLVDRVLASIGLDRTAVLLTPLVPWRPPGNRPLADAEIQACLPFLLRLLALVRPRHLVLLGATPVRALTGQTEPIRRLRGRWLEVSVPGLNEPVPALPLPPPDQWLRNAAAKQELWSDLIRLKLAAIKA